MPRPASMALPSRSGRPRLPRRRALAAPISSRARATERHSPTRRAMPRPKNMPRPRVSTGRAVSSETAPKLSAISPRMAFSSGPTAAMEGRRLRPTRTMAAISQRVRPGGLAVGMAISFREHHCACARAWRQIKIRRADSKKCAGQGVGADAGATLRVARLSAPCGAWPHSALKRIRLSLRARAWRSTMIGAQGLPEALTSALLLLFRSRRAWLRYSQRFSSFFSPAGLALCATSRAMRRSISGTSTLSSWPR